MSGLDRLMDATVTAENRVVGTYLYPYCLLGEPDWADPYSFTEVVETHTLHGPVYVTRNGGLFRRPPAGLHNAYSPGSTPGTDFEEKLEFQSASVVAFNRLICELALQGLVSVPATPVMVAVGVLIDNHALIRVGSGGRESYLERTLNPCLSLVNGSCRTWPQRASSLLDRVRGLSMSGSLAKVSDDLPTLVAGGYSFYSQGQLCEALVDAWIVIEQLLSHQWKTHIQTMSPERARRLSDHRTYSAAVKIEFMLTAGLLCPSLYDALSKARKHRNELVHGAKVTREMADETMVAMKQVLEAFLNVSVAQPQVSIGVTW